MCMTTSEMICHGPLRSYFRLPPPSKYRNIHVLHLFNRRSITKEAKEKEMEIKNLKLYLENTSIIEENNKLRRKALLLVQENQVLVSQLQQKCPHHACAATMKQDH